MAMTILEQNTGFGIYNPGVGTFRWNGHSFNPTGDTSCGYQTLNGYTLAGINYSVTTYNPTTSFDLTGFQIGNEVVVYFVKFENPDAATKTGTVTLRFKNSGGTVLFSSVYSFSLPQTYWYCCWIGMGIKEYPTAEINGNGTYRAEYEINYGTVQTGYKDFTVSNYPTTVSSTNVGAMWVEGNNLAFICNQRRKILVANDGSSSYVGTGYAGSMWLEEAGKITYIDSSGYKRKTKAGDKYGSPADTTELPKAPGTSYKGSMWVSNWFFDTYILIVSTDGISYRIGAGFVGAGDYQ